MMVRTMVAIGTVAVAAIVIFAATASFSQSSPLPADQSGDTKAIVPLDRIVGGGPGRDGIPSIDRPKFVSASDAGLQDSDLVLRLEINSV